MSSSKAPIRWRQSDVAELRRLVKNINSKRSRLAAKDEIYSKMMPETVKVSELRKGSADRMPEIRTRKDFNEFKKAAEKFLTRGSEEIVRSKGGAVSTKFEVEQMKHQIRQINAQRRERKKAAGWIASTEKGTMGAVRDQEYATKHFDFQSKNQENWNRAVRSARKQSKSTYYGDRDQLYKDNYKRAVMEQFAGCKNVNKLISAIDQVSGHKLAQLYYEDPLLQLNFIYDKTMDRETRVNEMTSRLLKNTGHSDEAESFESDNEMD